jgi:hypothetical protein
LLLLGPMHISPSRPPGALPAPVPGLDF